MATNPRPPIDGLQPTRKPSSDILEKIQRSITNGRQDSVVINQCWEFFRGNQYSFIDGNGLQMQPTITYANGTGKPRHRVRQTTNLIADIVQQEVSASIQRVPSYEINPSTSDPRDVNAARTAEKVALFGYDRWNIREATEKVVQHAVVGDEGFAWPYFDNTIGKVVDPVEGLAEGEIRIRVFGRNEVSWEPGCRFEDSPYHVVCQARPIISIESSPTFIGGPLVSDAASSPTAAPSDRRRNTSKMVMVTDYLELPTVKNPLGRWVTVANGRLIEEEKAYPCPDLGSPVLHKLCYMIDADSDRDRGLVRDLIDSQRIVNDCGNKQVEWKNLALNPQVMAPIGSMQQRLSDEPGAVFEYIPVGGMEPKWRVVPPIPPELEGMKNSAINMLGRIAAQNDIPHGVEAGRAIASLLERDANRRSAFISQLAEFHSHLMRHCLYLVQKHYTEARLLRLRGRFGWDVIRDFRGIDLRGQVDVRVYPGSIEPRTRAAIEQRVLNFADRQWISPQQAMSAINGGTAEDLIQDYELDIAWTNHSIQAIKDMEGGFTAPEQIPVARPFDNHDIALHVLTSWMKTQDYAMLGKGPQEAANLLMQQHEQLKADKQAQEAQAQQQMAQGLGMANAARPQTAPPLPSAPGSPVSAPGGTPSK